MFLALVYCLNTVCIYLTNGAMYSLQDISCVHACIHIQTEYRYNCTDILCTRSWNIVYLIHHIDVNGHCNNGNQNIYGTLYFLNTFILIPDPNLYVEDLLTDLLQHGHFNLLMFILMEMCLNCWTQHSLTVIVVNKLFSVNIPF